jgi:hypothetical protein
MSVLICFRTVGEALIVRRGLITLKVLKALKLKSKAKNSITLYIIQLENFAYLIFQMEQFISLTQKLQSENR